ncbi:unnamed protein product [Somion occarium]|uniref:F-box domain-containing protein n=1 Tax=Somion occarium TaxID=3059160 RepID=A0ABP1ED31_9APHY
MWHLRQLISSLALPGTLQLKRQPSIIPDRKHSLPPEIILEIFRHISEFFTPFDFGLNYIIPVPASFKLRAKTNFDTLSHLCLICRLWYPIAKAILYSHPLLLSSRQLRLFRRSLDSNPTLSNLVKGISIADNNRAYNFGFKMFSGRHTRHAERMRKNIRSVLMACTAVNAMSLHISACPYRNSIGNVLQGDFQLTEAHHLQTLTISGTGYYRSDFSAPGVRQLRQLCLHNAEFHSQSFSIQPFNRLQSLQLIRSFCFESRPDVIRALQNAPNLRQLDLVHNFFFVTSDDFLPCPSSLDRLTLIGTAELEILQFWSHLQVEALSSVRELTIGIIDDGDEFLAWTVPPQLESLTVLVYDWAWLAYTDHLGSLLPLVKKNRESSSSEPFKKVKIYIVVGGGKAEGKQFITKCAEAAVHSRTLHTLCKSLDIGMEVNYITTVDEWVKQNLS